MRDHPDTRTVEPTHGVAASRRPWGRGDPCSCQPDAYDAAGSRYSQRVATIPDFPSRQGELEHTLVGRHRRIKAENLFAYKCARDAKRNRALSDLAELDAEHLSAFFANRFTAFVDACALAGALKRNLLLTLAEAEFFRVRWSEPVLVETQRTIEDILARKEVTDATERAARARSSMEAAFEEAMVVDFGNFLPACKSLPDPSDAHVVAAALEDAGRDDCDRQPEALPSCGPHAFEH